MEAIAIGIIIMSGAIFVLSCVYVVVTFCREWAEMNKNHPYYPLVWLKWEGLRIYRKEMLWNHEVP